MAIWAMACRLENAWIKFGNKREKELQARSRGTPASIVYMENLAAEVFGQIADGDLLAFGFRLSPTISDGPVFIFADVFSEPSRKGWLEGEVQASGWSYERVRVLKRHTLETMLSPAGQMVDGNHPPLDTVSVDPSSINGPFAERRKRGPRSGEAELRRLYEVLLSDGLIAETHTVKEAHGEVVRFLKSTPSHLFPRGRGLSYSTFARAISTKTES